MRFLVLTLALAAASPAAAHDFHYRSFGEEQRLRQRVYSLELELQAAEHRARTQDVLARSASRPPIAAPNIDAQLAAQIEATSAAQVARIEASNARMRAARGADSPR